MQNPIRASVSGGLWRRGLSLTLLLGLGALAAVHAGDVSDYKSEYKNKNVIKRPPPPLPKFYFTIDGGSEVDFDATKYLTNGRGSLLGDPAHIDGRYFAHTHGPTAHGEGTFGYNLNQNISLFGRFEYDHAYTDQETIGRITDTNGLFGADTSKVYGIVASAKNYESFAGFGGVKISMPLAAVPSLKPYFSAAVGGKYDEAQSIHAGVLNVQSLGDVRLYRSSLVITTDARLGLEYDLSRYVALDLAGGVGYDGRPQRANGRGDVNLRRPTFADLGVSGVNKGGSRLYAPLILGIKYSF